MNSQTWTLARLRALTSRARALGRKHAAPLAMAAGATYAVLAWLVLRPVSSQNVEQRSLLLQQSSLEALLANIPARDSTGAATMLPPGGLVVSVREDFVRRLLERVLPYEHVFGDAVALRLDEASVSFRRGLASIELHGEAGIPGAEESLVALTVSGVLMVEDLAENREGLVTRSEVLGFRFDETEPAAIPPRLLRGSQRVAGEIVQDVGRLLGQVEIPIRLTTGLSIPAVDSDDISIEGVELPITLAIADVWVLNGRLFVSLDAEVAEAPMGPPAPDTGSVGEVPP